MPVDVSAVCSAARSGDHRALRGFCLDALRGGAPVAEIVEGLARAQVEIGQRWLSGLATTADEHRSTAAVDVALAALELQLAPPRPSRPVICVCAEGEWHSVASRMVALVFGAGGRDTIFLGPSLPAGELARFVTGAGAAAVAITCSSVGALPGAARCAGVVIAAGVPVVVGGHAFRAVPGAAQALGVPYVDDVTTAAAIIDDLAIAEVPTGLDTAGVAALDVVYGSLVDDASKVLLSGRALSDDEAGVVAEAVGYALGFGRAAVLLRDRSVLRDHMSWLDVFLVGRAAPVSADDLLAGVGTAVGEILRDRRELHPLFVP